MINKSNKKMFIVAALSICFSAIYFIINLHWLQQYRFNGLLDIDEAGYTAMGVNFARQLMGGGVTNWFNTFAYPNIYAPLSYATASLVMDFTGLSPNAGLITNAIYSSVTLFFTFLLAARLSSVPVAVFAVIVVLTNPYFTNSARSFEFTAASSASMIGMLYFLRLSEGLTKTIPAILCGMFAGLLLLSRTVNVSFVPGITIASLLFIVLTNKGSWFRVIGNAILLAIAAIVIAGPWYYINFTGIMAYLFSYGYGSHVAEYTHKASERIFSGLAHASALLSRMLILHMVVLSTLLVSYIVAALKNWRFIWKDRDAMFSAYIILVCLLCFGTLLTSENFGSGFDVPLIAALTVGLSTGLARLISLAPAKILVASVTSILCLALFIPQTDDKACLSLSSDRHNFPTNSNPIFSCGGAMMSYLEQGGDFDKTGGLVPNGSSVNRDAEREWISFNNQLGQKIAELNKQNKLVIFSARHVVVNINTVQLWSILTTGSFFQAGQIEPSQIDNSVDGYKTWLSDDQNKNACIFVANTSTDWQFKPAPTYSYLEKAFKDVGLVESASIPLPDGRQNVVFWTRPNACQ